MSSNETSSQTHGTRLAGYLGIALLACTTLLFEVAVTRLLSVLVWYHFAFLSLSLAMLGIGLPGVWSSLRPPGPKALRVALIAAAICVPGSVVLMVKVGEHLPSTGVILVAAVAVLGTMLALGSGICILLMEARGRRIGVSAVLLVPVGLLMGFAFPAGMIRFGDANKPWYWAVNGALSVCGSVLSRSLAILFGFIWVVTIGAAAYLGAVVLLQGRAANDSSTPAG